jgi:beta-1,4-mannosyltransferase
VALYKYIKILPNRHNTSVIVYSGRKQLWIALLAHRLIATLSSGLEIYLRINQKSKSRSTATSFTNKIKYTNDCSGRTDTTMELLDILQLLLPLAVALSTALTIFIATLPQIYNPSTPREFKESDFTEEDKKNADKTGYASYQAHKDNDGIFRPQTSVHVVVLGDIGRSPRMQYHALSIAGHGGRVVIVGYLESEVHPDIQSNRLISILPISTFPKYLQTNSKLLFLLTAPLKVLHQIWSLYFALAYKTAPAKWMLVQNPPSIPTLVVAQFLCFFRKTRLVIDWHNFGYSILALRLGDNHPLVRISKWYEGFFSSQAFAHFTVTNAMARVLRTKWRTTALALHDRPPAHFQPLSQSQRLAFLHRLPQTNPYASALETGTLRLIVSSTSWTPDEDFSILLDALQSYSASTTDQTHLPKILAIITGKGPQKAHYLALIDKLTQENKLSNITVLTAWLSAEDYASLLGSADLGISLHTSSSGVDLPMKVVDMFGAGLPVAGWGDFEAWPELVTEGVNGRGFGSAEGLTRILEGLFAGHGRELARLREGVLEEGKRRWDDEWMPVAGRLFELEG